MKIKLMLLAAFLSAFCSVGFAQSRTTSEARGDEQSRAHPSPQEQTAEELAKAVADAFGGGTLGSLDAGAPYSRRVKVVIEQSLGEFERESDRYTRKTFSRLEGAERWLKSLETRDGEMTIPRRNVGALQQCRKGVCTFERAGGLHNILYLHRINYGMRRGKPYLKGIYLVAD